MIQSNKIRDFARQKCSFWPNGCIYGSTIGTEDWKQPLWVGGLGRRRIWIVLSLDKLRKTVKAWPMEDGCENVEVASIRDGLKTASSTA